MSFPWWESKIPADYRATFPAKLEAMLVSDARRRAQILQSLGYGYDEALTRVRVYLQWDYEVNELPRAAAKVAGVVGEVYGRKAPRPERDAQAPVPAASASAGAVRPKAPARPSKKAVRSAKKR